MLSLILAILGIIVGFFVLGLGIILEIVAFFIAKKQMKNKEKFSNYAYYISLIAGIIQFIVWVAAIIYTTITVTNIIDEGNKELDKINNKHEAILEYSSMCSDKINIENYSSFEEFEKELDKCYDIIDECFDTYDQLDEAKKCADKIKK